MLVIFSQSPFVQHVCGSSDLGFFGLGKSFRDNLEKEDVVIFFPQLFSRPLTVSLPTTFSGQTLKNVFILETENQHQ